MITRLVSRARKRLTGDGSERGVVEVGVAAAGAMLVVGALVGNGLAANIVDMSDGQTWLPDGNGQIVQINPATGQPERRLIIGGADSQLEVGQRDGHLVVTDVTSGAVTAIDLAALVASGVRGTSGAESTRVLLGGGLVVMADLSPGTIRAVNPLTLADLGVPYRTDDLADVVIDDAGEVWLITTDGQLRSITFSHAAGQWRLGTDREVRGAGRLTRLVPHESGVTVFAPDGGAVVQVGVGPDTAVSAPALEGTVLPPSRSPGDLAPVSVTDRGLVLILADRNLLTVAVHEIGCGRPGGPEVFAGNVYVPCLGEGRVIVLDRHGARAGQDIIVPGGGDPELVVDDGRLIVRTDNDGRIVIVQPDGSTSTVDISGAEVPTHDAGRPAPGRTESSTWNPGSRSAGGQNQAPPDQGDDTPVQTPPQPDDVTDPTTPDQGSNDGQQDDSGGSSSNPPDDSDGGATDGSDGGATDDSGDGGEPGDGGDDGSDDDGTGDGDGSGNDGNDGDGDGDGGEPDPARNPSEVTATLTDGDVVVTWQAPEAEDTPTGYVVAASDGSTPVNADTGQTSATLTDLTCGRDLTITVTAQYAEGDPGRESVEVTTADCPGPDRSPREVTAALAGEDVVVSWEAPEAEDAGQGPTGYTVAASDGSTPVNAGAGATSATLTGLTCGRDLTITVTAQYAEGDPGRESVEVTTADCPVLDRDPTGVSAASVGEDVRVTWTAPEDDPAGYLVEASDGTSVEAGAAATSADLAGLACGQSLTITVTAQYTEGDPGTASTQHTTAACPVLDRDPTNVSASTSGSDVVVTWTPPEDSPTGYAVLASDGANATVGGSAMTATLTGVTCGSDLTVTVTAQYASGDPGSGTATVTTAACPPDPATAATGVQATAEEDGTARVTWTPASSGADAYVVRPVGGSGTTTSGTATQVVISGLTPGSSVSFEVVTQLGETTATSAPSNQVTIADVPSAPGSLSASVTGRDASTVTVAVSYSAASGNGSPVSGYRISYSGGGVSSSTDVTGTSATLTISCGGQALCTSGGELTVQVTATNAVGTGAAASTTTTVPAPPQPPGEVTGMNVQNLQRTGSEITGTITVGAPSSGGPVDHYQIVLDSGDAPAQTFTSGSTTISFNYLCGGFNVCSAGGNISVTATAINAHGSSGTVSGSFQVSGGGGGGGGGGEDPGPIQIMQASADLTDPGVEITPAPWTPPEVPNPPVLIAGLLLVGLAGVRRQLRHTAGRAGMFAGLPSVEQHGAARHHPDHPSPGPSGGIAGHESGERTA